MKQYRKTAIRKKESMQPYLKFMNRSHQPSAPTSPAIFLERTRNQSLF
jgi:hypothetical protein